MQLPQGIVAGLTDFTAAAWVNPAALLTWSRVFDLGDGEDIYMFMTVLPADQTPRFAITVNSNGHEQQLNAPSALPLNQWSHLAVTLAGTTATLYVNGATVDTNTSMTLSPTSLGPTTQNYIGKSQWPDPYLTAVVDEFQIYDSALTAAEVQSLTTSAGGSAGGGNVLWYRFDEARATSRSTPPATARNGTDRARHHRLDRGHRRRRVHDRSARHRRPLNDSADEVAAARLDRRRGGQRAAWRTAATSGCRSPRPAYRCPSSPRRATALRRRSRRLESQDGTQTFGPVRGDTRPETDWKQFAATLCVPRGQPRQHENRFVIGVDNRGAPCRRRVGRHLGLAAGGLALPADLQEPPERTSPGSRGIASSESPQDPPLPRRQLPRGRHRRHALGLEADDRTGLGAARARKLGVGLLVRRRPGAAGVPPARRGSRRTPVMGVWAGYALNGAVIPQAALGPYVQDALDQIEYAIGPVTSTWGARRAADGHPRPFRTPYIEIGNEDTFDRTGSYNAYRYPMFYDAIKAVYPQIKSCDDPGDQPPHGRHR